MPSLPPKKGSRMTFVCSPKGLTPEQLERQEVEAKLVVSGQRAFDVIEEARRKMKPEEREKADQKADAIIEGVLKTAKSSRRRA
jgi:hypothetical protein